MNSNLLTLVDYIDNFLCLNLDCIERVGATSVALWEAKASPTRI